METFYERITNLCNQKKIEITNLAKELKLSTSMPTNWKNGTLPSANTLILISEYFNVTIDYLIKGETKMDSNKIKGDGNNAIQNSPNANIYNLKNFSFNEQKENEPLLKKFVNEWEKFSVKTKNYFINMAKIENESAKINIFRDKQISFLNDYFYLTSDDNFSRIMDIFDNLSKKGDLIPFYCQLYNFLQDNGYEVAEWLKEFIKKDNE